MRAITAMTGTRRRQVEAALVWVLRAGFAVAFLLPFAWMLATSLTPQDELPSGHATLMQAPLPAHPTLANYARALDTLNFLPYLANTLYVCLLTVLGTVISCTLAAYGFSRIRWAGRDALFYVMLSTIMLPTTVLLLPQFVLFRELGWIGSYKPLVVPPSSGMPSSSSCCASSSSVCRRSYRTRRGSRARPSWRSCGRSSCRCRSPC
jgi:multiple sugar transport system permease protein